MRAIGVGVAAIAASAIAVSAAYPQTRGMPEVDVTNDPSYRWGELGMAVNPRSPNNIVIATVGVGFTKECAAISPDCKMVAVRFGGANGRLFDQPMGMFTRADFNRVVAFASFDGGKTWKRAHVPLSPANLPHLKGTGDPHVTVGPDGVFYFSFDDNDWGTAEKPLPSAAVAVSKSTDGGLTWSIPVVSGTPVDGPKMSADLSTGAIYAASSGNLGRSSTGDPNASPGPGGDRWLVSSQDGVTWSKPKPMRGNGRSIPAAFGMLATAFQAGAAPGLFAVANNELCDTAPTPCTIFQTTTDAGATWTRHVVSAPNDYSGSPLVAGDPARKGHFTLATQMKDDVGFRVYQTFDSGSTWSGGAVVSEDSTLPHFHGTMTYSRQGVLAIMWRTRQPRADGQRPTGLPAGGPGGGPVFPYGVWAAISRDGGKTFSVPLKVTSADSPAPDSSPFGGAGDDYSAVQVEGNNVYVAWADWRPAERANLFRAVPLNAFKFTR